LILTFDNVVQIFWTTVQNIFHRNIWPLIFHDLVIEVMEKTNSFSIFLELCIHFGSNLNKIGKAISEKNVPWHIKNNNKLITTLLGIGIVVILVVDIALTAIYYYYSTLTMHRLHLYDINLCKYNEATTRCFAF